MTRWCRFPSPNRWNSPFAACDAGTGIAHCHLRHDDETPSSGREKFARLLDVNRPGFTGGQNFRRTAMYGTGTEEDRDAVFPLSSVNVRCGWRWKTYEYQGEAAALTAVAGRLGCSPDSPRVWIRQGQRDGGERPGQTSAGKARIKELKREGCELRQTTEILKKALLPRLKSQPTPRLGTRRRQSGSPLHCCPWRAAFGHRLHRRRLRQRALRCLRRQEHRCTVDRRSLHCAAIKPDNGFWCLRTFA